MNKTVKTLERTRPEQAGIPVDRVMAFLDEIEDRGMNLHSFMLLRQGKVAVEGYYSPYAPERLHPIFSVSKSITSAAIGIAVGEGLLRLSDRVADFFPEKVEGELHSYTARMTIKDLLRMATVHPKSTDTSREDWVYGFLNTPPTRPPGVSFAYDTTGTHTLCAILQKVTGKTVMDYLMPRLFEPLGFGPLEWESCALGINKGGSGIRCTTEALAKFGQLYLQDGVWEGRRLLPEGWVTESTAKQIDISNARMMLDGGQGYGYQFWRVRHNAYSAFGMGGQLVVVLPDRETVFVTTANTMLYKDGQQQLLEVFWSTLYAGLQEQALPEKDEEYQQLLKRLEGLRMVLPKGLKGDNPAPREASISDRLYPLAPNQLGYEACRFRFDGQTSVVQFIQQGNAVEVPFGIGEWVPSAVPWADHLKTFCAGIWVDSQTFVLISQCIDPLQLLVWTCKFTEEEVPAGRMGIHIVPAGAWLNDTEWNLYSAE